MVLATQGGCTDGSSERRQHKASSNGRSFNSINYRGGAQVKMDTTEAFNEMHRLRNLRIEAAAHHARASEYLNRATHGTSSKRATDTGGTGRCPLTDYAERHAKAHGMYRKCADKANAIWERVRPLLAVYDYDTQCVVELYYNQAADMPDVARSVKRSERACERMQAHVCLTLKMG